jgi:hypothetical protein
MNLGSKRLEVLDAATNVAILFVAFTIIALAWFKFGPNATAGAVVEPLSVKAGQRVKINGIDWGRSQNTVLLVLSTQCHFCAEGVPFYRTISSRRKPDVFRVVAIFPEDVAAGRKFLSEHEIEVDDVIQQSLKTVGAKGTPTLLVVNRSGALRAAWIGKIGAGAEHEILRQMQL